MAYGSKTLSRKLQAIHAAAHSAGVLAPAIAEALAAKLQSSLPAGENLPDSAALVELLSRELEKHGQDLERLHQRHHHAMALETQARAHLGESAAQLRDALVDVRHLFDNHFGKRRGVADFEGREDVHRIPRLSLPRIAQGLLAICDDPTFGWHTYRDPEQVGFVRERLAERLAGYRQADESCLQHRLERKAAAAAAARGYQQSETRVRDLYDSLEHLFTAAGYTNVARHLRPKRPTRRRRVQSPAETPAAPT